MKHARLVDGTAVEVINFDPEGKFPPEFEWVECPDDTVQGATFDGENWTAPEAAEPESDPDQMEPAVALPLSRFIGLMTATKALTAAQAVEILKTSENPEIVLLRIMISGDGVMLDRDDPLVREGLQTLIDAEFMDATARDRVIAAWPTQA